MNNAQTHLRTQERETDALKTFNKEMDEKSVF